MKTKPIATIKMIGQPGRSALYWHDGNIWCREPGGIEVNTCVSCDLRDAIKSIREVWEHGQDLLFGNTEWIETIIDILEGHNLTACPYAVRAEMKKANGSLEDLRVDTLIVECCKAAARLML